MSKGSTSIAQILIIDAEASIRSLFRLVLEAEEHNITEACDGHEGLASYRRASADLVIADTRMPEMNGLDLLLALTRSLLDAKVTAISSEAEAHETLSNARLVGARHVLRKPFSLQTFPSLVRYELAH